MTAALARGWISSLISLGIAAAAWSTEPAHINNVPDAPRRAPKAPPAPDLIHGKPRLFVLSDIGNEPDDQMSMVRLVMYANEIDIEGLVADTSVWQREATHPETIRAIVESYGVVRPNLLKHASGWPTAEQLSSTIATGQPAYGMAAVGPGKSTAGSRALVTEVDRPDPRPLWVGLWGGANTLAQALLDVKAARTPAQVDAFVAKLRIYSISDQDDAGPWIRSNFPKLFYVADPSSPNSEDYARATWTGISGDGYYRNGEGADGTTITNEWLDVNIRAKGPLGKHYLKYAFIMEGDTPSFLNLIGNGLEGYRSPSWGGWGGRYIYRVPQGETREIWTQGGDEFGRIDSRDTVTGADGKPHVSNQATIWRWRNAFQNDFAARMDWTIKPFSGANHEPNVVLNGQDGIAPIFIDAEFGKPIVLDAGGSSDPDRQNLSFRWFAYSEAGFSPGISMADISLSNETSAKTMATATGCHQGWLPIPFPCKEAVAHVILAVTDNGSPALTSYRRVVIRARQLAAAPEK